ncbi:MAG: N,N-dimethylformamidase beta subunit family domain-containing protein [Catenulispora sp.]
MTADAAVPGSVGDPGAEEAAAGAVADGVRELVDDAEAEELLRELEAGADADGLRGLVERVQAVADPAGLAELGALVAALAARELPSIPMPRPGAPGQSVSSTPTPTPWPIPTLTPWPTPTPAPLSEAAAAEPPASAIPRAADRPNLWRSIARSSRAARFGLAAAVVIACAADLPAPRSAPVIDDQRAAVHVQERAHHGAPLPGDGGKAAGPAPAGGALPGEPSCSAEHRAGWLRVENQLAGTTAWQDAKRTRAGSVNGYLNRVSAQCGDTVTAYLSSPVPVSAATLSAYRMGYYNGTGGRLVWEAKHLTVGPQAQATVTGTERLTEAPWKASLSFRVSEKWTPGYYLLVVRAPGQSPSSIPLVVRADGDAAPLGFQASVLTYQAYNTFGGHSAYNDPAHKAAPSTVVSFDRPYEDGGYYSPYQYELPLIREMEKLGIDADYFTDLDVDGNPALLTRHKGIVTGGHSEYWTKRMYDAAVAARQAGVNLAFFGANAVYTAARLTGSPLGPDRRVVIRRTTAGDAVAAKDPSQATVNWAEPPLNRPEAALVGQGYGYLGANGSLRVLHPDSWIFTGTGVAAGTVLTSTVGGEYDQVEVNKAATPKDVDVLAAMPIRFANGHAGMATTTYYVATSQAGVFDAGTTYWPCVIAGDCLHLTATPTEARRVVMLMTDNILTAFAAGPAGLAHASTPNLPPSPEGLVASAKSPGDVALRSY